MVRKRSASWAKLPLGVFLRLFEKLYRNKVDRESLQLRAVCKTWCQFFTAIPAELDDVQASKLDFFCQTFPQMAKIAVEGPFDNPRHAMEAILLNVRLPAPGSKAPPEKPLVSLKLDRIPTCIKALDLSRVNLDFGASQSINFPQATYLKLSNINDGSRALKQMLDGLPSLKELNLRCLEVKSHQPSKASSLEKWPKTKSLTSLHLSHCTPSVVSLCLNSAPGLRNLFLEEASIEANTATALRGLAKLSSLSLMSCNVANNLDIRKWKLLPNLQKLELSGCCDELLSALPPLPAKSLFFDPMDDTYVGKAVSAYIGRLKKLETLEIRSARLWDSVKPLQKLPKLERLSLTDCHRLAMDILKPSALPSLKVLHLESEEVMDNSVLGSEPDSPDSDYREQRGYMASEGEDYDDDEEEEDEALYDYQARGGNRYGGWWEEEMRDLYGSRHGRTRSSIYPENGFQGYVNRMANIERLEGSSALITSIVRASPELWERGTGEEEDPDEAEWSDVWRRIA